MNGVSQVAQVVKKSPAGDMRDTGSGRHLGREDPLEESIWQPTPVFLPEEPHGQSCLWSTVRRFTKESGMTEVTLHTRTKLS